jgi:O-antigen/teichoic acid export membrane protein
MEQIKNFFYPNKGILGVFALWAVFVLLMLFFNPLFKNIYKNQFMLLQDVVVNLIIMYLLSCLSIWIYERINGKGKKKK